jgi:hypothetical protein
MKISYRRTGGFAGMILSYDIDVDTLPPEEAQELETLVSKAEFFTLPAEIRAAGAGTDQFQYTLTIETDQAHHTVECGDAAMPENLWPLVNKIRILSRSKPNQ